MRSLDRRAGLLLPLFSMRSTHSWGVGDIADLARMGPWLREAGLRLLQVLPVNDMATGQTSPYSALSAMAIEPLYIAVDDVADVQALGDAAFQDVAPGTRERLNAEPVAAYEEAMDVKARVLRRAYTHFRDVEWLGGTDRARALQDWMAREQWWLDEYALFRVLHDALGARPWWDWPEDLAARQPEALADARRTHADAVLEVCWQQWVAQTQWDAARQALEGIALVGDVPFMVSTDSADVWAHQHLFSRDATVGTPPDAFSAEGQDWGLPVYRWDAMRADDFGWLRARARRMAEMFDAFRVDHLVGFYRTFWRPVDKSTPFFVPADEPEQERLGQDVITAFASGGAVLIAEDLGTIPDFVRASMAHLGLPGYKVLRWERDWHHLPDMPFLDPARYPATSLATTGTHDTDMLADWWDQAPREEREAVLRIPRLQAQGFDPAQAFDDRLRDALLELIMHAGSDLVVVPIQDLFGWRGRVNVPGTVGPGNWSWVTPIPVDRLMDDPLARDRAAHMRAWSDASGRR